MGLVGLQLPFAPFGMGHHDSSCPPCHASELVASSVKPASQIHWSVPFFRQRPSTDLHGRVNMLHTPIIYQPTIISYIQTRNKLTKNTTCSLNNSFNRLLSISRVFFGSNSWYDRWCASQRRQWSWRSSWWCPSQRWALTMPRPICRWSGREWAARARSCER